MESNNTNTENNLVSFQCPKDVSPNSIYVQLINRFSSVLKLTHLDDILEIKFPTSDLNKNTELKIKKKDILNFLKNNHDEIKTLTQKIQSPLKKHQLKNKMHMIKKYRTEFINKSTEYKLKFEDLYNKTHSSISTFISELEAYKNNLEKEYESVNENNEYNMKLLEYVSNSNISDIEKVCDNNESIEYPSYVDRVKYYSGHLNMEFNSDEIIKKINDMRENINDLPMKVSIGILFDPPKCLQTLEGHTNDVNIVCKLSGDENGSIYEDTIISGSTDGNMRIWNNTKSLNEGDGFNQIKFELKQVLEGHTDVINSVCEINDKMLASVSEDKTMKIWKCNNNNYECIQTLNNDTEGLGSICYLGNRLIATCSGNEIKLWRDDANTITEYKLFQVLGGNDSDINTLCQVNGALLVSGFLNGTIKVWRNVTKNENNIINFGCIQTINKAHNDTITSITNIKDCLFATASSDCSVKVWKFCDNNYENDENKVVLLKTLDGVNDGINSICYLGGGFIMAGCMDGTITMWDRYLNFNRLHTVSAHNLNIQSLCKIRNGLIASGSEDNKIKIWMVNELC